MTNKTKTIQLYRFEPFRGDHEYNFGRVRDHRLEQLDPSAQNFVLDCFEEHTGQPYSTNFILEQCFYTALHSSKKAFGDIRFYRADKSHEGNQLYDNLPRVEKIEFLTPGQEGLRVDTLLDEGELKIRLTICTPKMTWFIEHDAPLFIKNSFDGFSTDEFEEMAILISKNSELLTTLIVGILENSAFSYCDDRDHDSYDTQLSEFLLSASHRVISLLETPIEATRRTLDVLTHQHLIWFLPDFTEATIKISNVPDDTERVIVQVVKK